MGRRLGRQEGTTPNDDPQLGRHRRQARDAGRADGRAEGIARERALLARLAARKFDPRTAECLAGRLTDIEDPGRHAGIGDLIIDCGDGEDLLSRLA